MNEHDIAKQRKAGVHFFDVQALRENLRERGISEQEFAKRVSIDPKTRQKLFSGLGIRDECVNKVLAVLGIKNRTGLVFAEGEDRESHFSDTLRKSGIQEWDVDAPLTPVITASNGLQYRVYRLTHRHQKERMGRGKRYEFLHLPDNAQESLKEQLIRHPKVCDRVGPHPQFPICYGTFPDPDSKAWWVIDRWIDGESLKAKLANGLPLDSITLKRVALEIAEGLNALHEIGIIRRELSPAGVLFRSNGSVVLTDFELAKLLDGSPSVSRDWRDNPYRAPEVSEANINAQADIYSWARIVTHCALGNLPPIGSESDALSKLRMPTAIRTLILSCLEVRKSLRPLIMAEVLPVIKRWK